MSDASSARPQGSPWIREPAEASGPVSLPQLVAEFYDTPADAASLGQFAAVDRVPPPFDQLLDHHGHMTETVEAFHQQAVGVRVYRCHIRDQWYAREITLHGQQSGRTVQYGIVRLDISALHPDVWRQIESRTIPLGRVLIRHDVLREVELCQLWRVVAGAELARRLGCPLGDTVYGRTALIHCDAKPAIELLEIVRA